MSVILIHLLHQLSYIYYLHMLSLPKIIIFFEKSNNKTIFFKPIQILNSLGIVYKKWFTSFIDLGIFYQKR